jgi:hypothetical protein
VEDALDRLTRLASAAEARGDTHELIELRAVELAIRVARGQQPAPAEVDWLVERARAHVAVDATTFAATSAAAALATDAPEQSRTLLEELARTTGSHQTPYYARLLPLMVRTLLTADDPALARRLVEGLEPHYPLDEHALCAARAQLAEHAGDRAEAAELYAEAARRWQEFGNVSERAYALALGKTDAEGPLCRSCSRRCATGRRSPRPRRCWSKRRARRPRRLSSVCLLAQRLWQSTSGRGRGHPGGLADRPGTGRFPGLLLVPPVRLPGRRQLPPPVRVPDTVDEPVAVCRRDPHLFANPRGWGWRGPLRARVKLRQTRKHRRRPPERHPFPSADRSCGPRRRYP